jgi:hypothetical protein
MFHRHVSIRQASACLHSTGFGMSPFDRLKPFSLAAPISVIARLDPKSGLPDFGTYQMIEIGSIRFRLAIQYPRSMFTRSPGQAGR